MRALRCLLLGYAILLFGGLLGCSRQDVRERTVSAGSAEELAGFLQDVQPAWSGEDHAHLETALQELKLQAMNAGVSGVAAREEGMRAAINGKTVREALVLGWQARWLRFTRELEDMTARLERDSALQVKAKTAESVRFFENLISNERDLIAQMKAGRADAEAKLAAWGAQPPPSPDGVPAAAAAP